MHPRLHRPAVCQSDVERSITDVVISLASFHNTAIWKYIAAKCHRRFTQQQFQANDYSVKLVNGDLYSDSRNRYGSLVIIVTDPCNE